MVDAPRITQYMLRLSERYISDQFKKLHMQWQLGCREIGKIMTVSDHKSESYDITNSHKFK